VLVSQPARTAGLFTGKNDGFLRFIRTFGDQVSVLNHLQPVSVKLKIAPKSLT
jgi:hypothetical protein